MGKITAREIISGSVHQMLKVTNLKARLFACYYERKTWIGRDPLSRNEIRVTRSIVITNKPALYKVASIMDSPSKNVFDHVNFRDDLPVQYLCDVW